MNLTEKKGGRKMLAERDKTNFTLKMLRAKYDLTQKQAGKRVGVSGDVWHNWEKAKSFPDVIQLKEIEKAFDVAYDYIIFSKKNNG